MRCPFCNSEDTQVKDSRPAEDGAAIRRRRICPDCGGRFTTYERVQLRELMVIKKSGRKLPFDRVLKILDVEIFFHHRHLRINSCIAELVRNTESGLDEILDRRVGQNGIIGRRPRCHPLEIKRQTHTGARLVGKASLLLKRDGGRHALATQCIGGGQGIAMVLEAA